MSSQHVLAGILDNIHTRAEQPALKDVDEEFSYRSVGHEVGLIAAALAARGVSEGDRVALDLPNSASFPLAAVACLWVGAVFVPLAVGDPEARVLKILDDCRPAAVIHSEKYDDEGRRSVVRDRYPSVSMEGLRAARSATVPDPVMAEDGAAYIIYTSGTTGTPKGVLIGHQAFVAAVREIVVACGLSAASRTLCVSPFHFDGSFATLFPTLYCGGAVVVRPREALLFPRSFFRAVAQEDITYTGFSPSYLRLLVASPQLSSLEATKLDVIALGGEASSLADVRTLWAQAPRVQVLNRYGPTETTIAVTSVKLTPELTADGTVPIGRPNEGVQFFLVDEGGVIDEPDRVGELYIAGTQLMTGYWGAPELSAEVLRSDVIPGATVYRTGDLMYRDARGNYLYVDRVDRVIKRSGVRISLVEIAEAMRQLAAVSGAACTVFDNEGQLGIVAFVVATGSNALDLRRAAGEALPDTMLPDRIELVDALPLTGSSKLDERQLLAAAGLVAWSPGGSGRPSAG